MFRMNSFRAQHYGLFDDRTFDFGSRTPVTLLYGPNEAGKSSLRRMITAFLYGLDARNDPDDYASARGKIALTAELAQDGAVSEYLRRRSAKDSLSLQSGSGIAGFGMDGPGGLTRERFLQFWSVDPQALRDGTRTMLEGGAEAGLFAAATGLHDLDGRIAELEKSADAILGGGAAKKPLNLALKELGELRTAARGNAWSAAQFQALNDRIRAAEQEVADAQAGLAAHTGLQNDLARLDGLQQRIAARQEDTEKQQATLAAKLAEQGEVLRRLQLPEVPQDAFLAALPAFSQRLSAQVAELSRLQDALSGPEPDAPADDLAGADFSGFEHLRGGGEAEDALRRVQSELHRKQDDLKAAMTRYGLSVLPPEVTDKDGLMSAGEQLQQLVRQRERLAENVHTASDDLEAKFSAIPAKIQFRAEELRAQIAARRKARDAAQDELSAALASANSEAAGLALATAVRESQQADKAADDLIRAARQVAQADAAKVQADEAQVALAAAEAQLKQADDALQAAKVGWEQQLQASALPPVAPDELSQLLRTLPELQRQAQAVGEAQREVSAAEQALADFWNRAQALCAGADLLPARLTAWPWGQDAAGFCKTLSQTVDSLKQCQAAQQADIRNYTEQQQQRAGKTAELSRTLERASALISGAGLKSDNTAEGISWLSGQMAALWLVRQEIETAEPKRAQSMAQTQALQAEASALSEQLGERASEESRSGLQAQTDALHDRQIAAKTNLKDLVAEKGQRLRSQDSLKIATQIRQTEEKIADLAGQYQTLKLAAQQLKRAKAAFEQNHHQDRLAAVSGAFSALTDGRYENFFRADEQWFAGRREDGELAGVQVPHQLSAGTRTSLFLAMRLAFLAGETGGPPLILDDAFEELDDERAALAFQAITRSLPGRQVLYFTHHRHMADVAARALSDQVFCTEI